MWGTKIRIQREKRKKKIVNGFLFFKMKPLPASNHIYIYICYKVSSALVYLYIILISHLSSLTLLPSSLMAALFLSDPEPNQVCGSCQSKDVFSLWDYFYFFRFYLFLVCIFTFYDKENWKAIVFDITILGNEVTQALFVFAYVFCF